MKNVKKIVMGVVAALALVTVSVMGTLAYLTSQDSVENTFTVGNVSITLDEADVKTDGTYENDANQRVDKNTYHLMPDHTYIKDPTVWVDNKSENCFIYVEVTNGLAKIIDENTIEKQITDTYGWNQLTDENDTAVPNVYYKEFTKDETVTGEITKLVVFDKFKIKSDVDGKTLESYDTEKNPNAKITVNAYAIQKDTTNGGITTPIAGWNAVKSANTSTPDNSTSNG